MRESARKHCKFFDPSVSFVAPFLKSGVFVTSMRYLHLDVFTDTPFEGNQLAVCLDPPGDISSERMQKIAQEMNFSETTFVFPKEGAGDVKMRIFTPASELPVAGHPTIGSTFALAIEGVLAPGRQEFVFELGVGPIPVSLEWEDRQLRFAWMTQPLPSFGDQIEHRAAISAAVGLDEREILDLPIETVSCGVPFLFVPITSREAVDRVSIDLRSLRRVYKDAGLEELPVFFFTTDRSGAAGDESVYSRMLAPGFGIAEDPATGIASGPLGCYLLYHGVVSAEHARALISLQGAAMKRPSRIYISIDSRNDTITRVRIGGKAVLVAEGRVLV
jgi:trans-2,3-dihydro-3-hydroxyanthranilate isomerase